MTTLEKISNYFNTPPSIRGNTIPFNLLIESKAEIERLEKQNTLLKSALIEICDKYRSSRDMEEKCDCMARIAQEALKE